MVTVKDYKVIVKDDGASFLALILQGGLEMIKSQKTGKYYATVRTASLPTTFDEASCKLFIGEQFDGSINKVECDAYNYTIKETGEVIELSHRYEYISKEEAQINSAVYGNSLPPKLEIFSTSEVEEEVM